jgi:hypothetical protein
MRTCAIAIFFLTLLHSDFARSENPLPVIFPIARVNPSDATGEIKPEPATRSEPKGGPMCSKEISDGQPYPDFFGVLVNDPATEEERRAIYAVMDACKKSSRRTTDPFQLLALLRAERMYGVPDAARGITLGVLCVEVSLREKSSSGGPFRGDWLNGVARAHGPFQLHDWFRAWCGAAPGSADDLLFSAGCYLARVESVLPKVKGCKNPWRVAEAATANYRRYGFRCESKSDHWKVIERAFAR